MHRRPPKRRSQLVTPLVILGTLALLTVIVIMMASCQNESTEPTIPQPPKKIAVEITMVGEESITIEVGETYTDAGASAAWHYADEPNVKHALVIQCDNPVDTTKPGTYTITYTAQHQDITNTATRQVHVVDTQAPVIELQPTTPTIIGQTYVEDGYKATDNCDGDITEQVQRIVADDGKTITYQVSDSSGNTFEIVREIIFVEPEKEPEVDRTAPVLKLKGESSITITEGNKWTDPGCTATDDVDGDLTDKITVEGTVKTNTPGTYTLTYSVKDQQGNSAKVKRTVIVKAAPKPETPDDNNTEIKGDGNGKVIYLTFDDGPSDHTEKLLGILSKYNVKATFFVCKTGRMDLLDDIVAGGHTIGVHTTSHEYSKIYASEEAFFKDFDTLVSLIEEKTGITPTVSRFPGGSSNGISKKYNVGIMTRLAKYVQERGFQYFDWNIDSDDAGKAKTADAVYNNVVNGISKSKSKNLVVLQHDIKGYSVNAVERIIIWGLENGYTFAALTNSSPTCHHSIKN